MKTKDCCENIYNPTTQCDHLSLQFNTQITYKLIHGETLNFIKQNEKYLKYPKLYLQTSNPQCHSSNCAQCQNTKGTFNYIICSFKRKEIANDLFSQAQQGLFLSDELRKTVAELCMSDKILMDSSAKYILNENWFVGVYSYLSWQKEMVGILLHNLAYFNSNSNNEKIISCKFALLTLVHSYLEQVIECLVFYFSCFDTKRWLTVFYPFICQAIGNKQCSMLFASIKNVLNHVDTSRGIGIVALETATGTQDSMDENAFAEMNLQTEEILCSMKALSSFKQLIIYNRSDNDDLDDEVNDDSKMEDPDMIDSNSHSHVFEMVNQIYSKLQEMVWNIKTQLAICEIRGITLDNGDGGEESDSKEKDEVFDDNFNDYWKVDSDTKPALRLPVPSFSRVFIIQRVLKHHTSTGTEISRLVCNTFKDKEIQKVADFVLSLLLTHGIKHFMSQFYNEDLHSNVIEMIFHQIIITKFEKEYFHITTYKTINKSNNKYQQLVFNTKDLMCSIFEYFDWNFNFDFNMNENEIESFSLVCSHWLYHTWNPNSMYHCDLSELVHTDDKQQSKISRTWQRVIHAKSIVLNLASVKSLQLETLVISKLLAMKSIVKTDIEIVDVHPVEVLKAIMQNRRKNIEDFRLQSASLGVTNTLDDLELSPLRLPNARFISIDSNVPERFPIIWSNKCIKLNLEVADINDEWINHVLKYCDCSCIKRLNIFESHKGPFIKRYINLDNDFDHMKNYTIDDSIEKLAQQFTALERFHIRLGIWRNDELILFWRCLWDTIRKNDTKVTLTLEIGTRETDVLLVKTLNDAACKIDSIEIIYNKPILIRDGPSNNDKIVQLIASSRAKQLTIDVWQNAQPSSAILQLSTIGKQLKLGLVLIQMLKYTHHRYIALQTIYEFLQVIINIAKNRKLFIVLDFGSRSLKNDLFKNVFDLFCQTIFSLVVCLEITANIKIRFENISESEFNETYFPMYLEYFDKKRIFKEYKKPESNQWCKALVFPHIEFIRINTKQDTNQPFVKALFAKTIFHATNVSTQ